jgi:hypothetical protein
MWPQEAAKRPQAGRNFLSRGENAARSLRGASIVFTMADPLENSLDEMARELDEGMAPVIGALQAGDSIEEAWVLVITSRSQASPSATQSDARQLSRLLRTVSRCCRVLHEVHI